MEFPKSNPFDPKQLETLANALFRVIPGEAVPTQELALNEETEKQFQDKKAEYAALETGNTPGFVREPIDPFGNGDYHHSPGSARKALNPKASLSEPYAFNISDPQTSHPDPHFYDGKIPKSVSGIGKEKGGERTQPTSHQGISPAFQDNPTTFIYGLGIPKQEFEKATSHTSGAIPFQAVPSESAFYFRNPDKLLFNPIQPEFNPFNRGGFTSGGHGYAKPDFDLNLVKKDFPILNQKINGRSLVWFDNAATTQKPKQVIDRIRHFYEYENSNVHRAAHELAARSTDAYEGAREKVKRFINAASVNEIIFVRGTTEAINLVAKSWGDQQLQQGDEIILSHLEHHANIVPWQQLAEKKGLVIRVIPVDDDGQILIDEYGKLLNPKTKLVSFTHVSNALGTVTPAKQIIDMAHAQGAKVLLDGAQSISHLRVDLQYLDPDFFVFSGHKVFGPTGIGVIYGKEEILNQTAPWQGGGNMIKDVTFEKTLYHDAPGRFEAGTGNIADAVGLGAALDYVSKLGIEAIGRYEHQLLHYATSLFGSIPGLKIIGTARDKASVLSFTLQGYTNDEVGQILNKEGIAVRTGHHCAQPILRRFGLESTVRPSLAFYNSCSEVDRLVDTLHRLADQKRGKLFTGYKS